MEAPSEIIPVLICRLGNGGEERETEGGGIICHHRLCVPKELLLELVVDVCGFQPSQLCSDPEQTLKSSSS